MRIVIPDIPNRCNAFTVDFPVPPRDRKMGEYQCDYQARFSDACYALELDGWKEWRFDKPPMNLPVLLMRPEWREPQVVVPANYFGALGRPETAVALYWKLSGIARELSDVGNKPQ